MKYSMYAPAVARYGVSFVFLVFGVWQIINYQLWLGYLPSFALNLGISAKTVLMLNGTFDFLIGLSLLTGIFLRIFSGLGILHLLGIIFSLGWNDVTVRDIGIILVLISVFLHGKDDLCFGSKKTNS